MIIENIEIRIKSILKILDIKEKLEKLSIENLE